MKLYYEDRKEIGRTLTREEFIEVVKRDPGVVYDSLKRHAVAFDLDNDDWMWGLVYLGLDGNICIDE